MSRFYNPRTKRWEDDGAVAPAPGSTVAKDVSPVGGLVSGGATSTAGAALAARPTVFQQQPVVTPAQHAATVLTPTLASQGARPAVDPAAGPAVAQALRANAGDTSTTVGKIGPAIQGSLSGDPLTNLAGTTAFKGGGFATTGGVVDPNGPAEGGTGIYENGVAVTKGANGAFKGAPGTRASLLKDAATASNVPSSQPAPAGGPPVNQFQEDQKTIASLYPDVAKAGSDANKRFVQAFTQGYSGRTTDGKDFNHQAGNTATALDLANQLFAGTTTEAPITGKAADEAATATVASNQARAAQNPTPSTETQAGREINSSIVSGTRADLNAITAAPGKVGDFLGGLFGVSPQERTQAANTYGVSQPPEASYTPTASGPSPLSRPLSPVDATPDTVKAAPSSVIPTNPLNNLAPAPATVAAPATTPILPPVPDPNEEAKKKLAQSSVPTFMQ